MSWLTHKDVQVLQHLCANPGDFEGAIKRVPRHIRLLWCRALSSHIWNKVVSLRLQQNMGVLKRDLVACPGNREAFHQVQARVLEEGEETSTPLSQVLVPVLGFAVEMPDNESRDLHHSVLQQMGLDLAVFAQPDSKDGFYMPGGYRSLLCQPTHLNHTMLAYPRQVVGNREARLISTDLDHVLDEPLATNTRPLSMSMRPDLQEEVAALVLEFRLPRASYATMAIRELMQKCNMVMFLL